MTKPSSKVLLDDRIDNSPRSIMDWVKNNYRTVTSECDVLLEEINVQDLSKSAELLCEYYNLTSVVKFTLGNYYRGIYLLKRGIQVAAANNLVDMQVKMLINLSSSLGKVHKFNQALECINQALEFDIAKYNPNAYFNRIKIFEGLEEKELQLAAIEKTKEEAQKVNDSHCFKQALASQANFYLEQEDYKSALVYCLQYEDLDDSSKSNFDRISNIKELAVCYIKTGEISRGMTFLDLGIKLAEESDEQDEKIRLYKEGFQASYESNDFDLARKFYDLIFSSEYTSGLEDIYLEVHKINIELKKKNGSQLELIEAYKSFKEFASLNTTSKTDSKNEEYFEFTEKEIEEVSKTNDDILVQFEDLQIINQMLSNDLTLPIKAIERSVDVLKSELKENDSETVHEYLEYLEFGANDSRRKLEMAETFLNYDLEGEFLSLSIKRILEDVIDNMNLDSYEFQIHGAGFNLKSSHHLVYDLFHNVFLFTTLLNTDDEKKIEIKFDEGSVITISDSGNGVFKGLENYRDTKNRQLQNSIRNIHIAYMQKLVHLHKGNFSFRGYNSENSKLIIKLKDLENKI